MLQTTGRFAVFSLPDQRQVGDDKRSYFDEIYAEHTYKTSCDTSLKDRSNFGKHISYTYGEISSVVPMECMFELIRDDGGLTSAGGIFYDLGSGIGKPVIAAALLHPFKICTGIEILPGLHEIALLAKENFLKTVPTSETIVNLVCGSILDLNCVDWTDGDVVYANSTCFDNDMMVALSALGARMKSGSYFITLSRMLSESHGFRLLAEERLEMSWGMADYYLHKKI